MAEENLVEFDEAVGHVEAYDPASERATVRLDRGLRVGDIIQIMGAAHGSPEVLTIADLLVDEKRVESADAGARVQIRVARPVSYLDDVFVVSAPHIGE